MKRQTWFRRGDDNPGAFAVTPPAAWRYNAPASDTVRSSTTVQAAATPLQRDGKGTKIKRGKTELTEQPWQDEAWQMYDAVGELRYVSQAICGRASMARLFVEDTSRAESDPEREDDESDLLTRITPAIVERLALNLFVAGSAWLVGAPKQPGNGGGEVALADTTWHVLSTREFKPKSGKIKVRGQEYSEEELFAVRVWNPHPATWNEADSPVRSALPVLRELVGLTQYTSAQIDSRLAGAGVYWIPNSILSSSKTPDSMAPLAFDENPVLNAIMSAMLLPMEDRSNASSVVPLLIGAPGEEIDKIRYDSFSTPFDKQVKELREESLQRLGLSLDAPPELLKGMGDANHWGMWLVRDEIVQSHILPKLTVICDALTEGFLRPLLEQVDPGRDASRVFIRPDVSQLVQRPNRLSDASQLHAVDVINDKTLREAAGFDESDAPTPTERAIKLAVSVAAGNPQLLDNMAEIVAAVTALLDGSPETGPETVSSSRAPGTLRPASSSAARPVSAGPKPAAPAAQPIADAEGAPSAGPPVA